MTDLKPFEFASLEEMITYFNGLADEHKDLEKRMSLLRHLIYVRHNERHNIKIGDKVVLTSDKRERGHKKGTIVQITSIGTTWSGYANFKSTNPLDEDYAACKPLIRGYWRLKAGGWSQKPMAYATREWEIADESAMDAAEEKARKERAKKQMRAAAKELGIDPAELGV